MDQEDFEVQAAMGERPVGNWHDHPVGELVYIPAAADSDARYDRPIPYTFDDATGRIGFAGPLPVAGSDREGQGRSGEGGFPIHYVTSDPGGELSGFYEQYLGRLEAVPDEYKFQHWPEQPAEDD